MTTHRPAARWRLFVALLLFVGLTLPLAPARAAPGAISLQVLGRYETAIFGEGAAEIVKYDPATQQLFVVKATAAAVDILDISDPTQPTKVGEIDASTLGGGVNSVDVKNGIVAVAVEAADPVQPGQAAFFTTDGTFLSAVPVGVLPDMIVFTPDGQQVLTADEGQPSDDYATDPEGTVSIVDLSGGAAGLTAADVTTVRFSDFNEGGPRNDELDPTIRIFGPGASVAQDLEPEYIAISADSATAWVTLQENNALAVLNLADGSVTTLVALGYKDHSAAGNGLDASDRDDSINIAPWPVRGLYQPDAIAAWESNGATYLITANEGDARDYDAFGEEERVADLVLDPTAFPDAATLQADEALGRLNVTTANGDTDGDGDFDALYSFGARSFTIWSGDGALVWDSGDGLEQQTAAALPDFFNATNDDNDSFDNRSDNKGPEPEGVTTGVVGTTPYAFIALERIGGIMVYDLSDPAAPVFVQYINPRDFAGDPEASTAGDLGPEGLTFIPAADSPTGEPLLAVANEVSGSTTVFGITDEATAVQLDSLDAAPMAGRGWLALAVAGLALGLALALRRR